MINFIWVFMLAMGVLTALINGRIDLVTKAAMDAAKTGVELAFGLIGVMALWMGMMKIAEKSGLLELVSIIVRPLVRLVFPSLPRNHPAIGAIVGNLSANLLGLGNAATPLGLKAMQEMQGTNPILYRATDAMCTFLALNTACLTVVPATVIALRMAAGSKEPTAVISTTFITTLVTTVSALILDALLRRSRVIGFCVRRRRL